jgi:hypothetical protein
MLDVAIALELVMFTELIEGIVAGIFRKLRNPLLY